MPNTVTLSAGPYVFQQSEYNAAATISPGHLVEITSGGKVQKNSTASSVATERMWAVEDELQGNTLADDYSSGDNVLVRSFVMGAEVFVFLQGGSTAVKQGDFLESAGDGTLKSGSTGPVAVAMEDKDLSASGTADARIKARVL